MSDFRSGCDKFTGVSAPESFPPLHALRAKTYIKVLAARPKGQFVKTAPFTPIQNKRAGNSASELARIRFFRFGRRLPSQYSMDDLDAVNRGAAQ